jgi:hypothetical protein
MKKFIFVILILGLAVAAAGFWYWNKNSYSKEILKLEILGPEKVSLSQEVEYTVKYRNNGDVKLEEPRLVFEFPKNTILVSSPFGFGNESDFSERIEIGPEELGDIYPGEEKSFKFKGRLLGRKGEVKTAKAWLSYHPKNLKARYESATTLAAVIDSVPLTLDFDLSSKIESGRDFKFSLNYFSNLDYPLSNLGVKIEYPPGFEFIKSRPTTLDKTEWDIPLLNKAEGGRIEIEGRLSGKVREQKIFKSILGIWRDNEFIPLKEATRGAEIANPHLYIFQEINGQREYIASPGDLLHYEIYFRNIGAEAFRNLFLAVTLNNQAFDFDSLKSHKGQFSRGSNSIVWDWRDVPALQFLDQGEEGKVEFWIKLKEDWQIKNYQEKNPVLKDVVLLSQIRREFDVKLNSKVVISQKGYYQGDVFVNSGPIPPQAGKETTYTIIWQGENYYNDLKNVKVKAVLPSNVRLTGRIFPESESSNFSFDSQSREIVWSIKGGQTMKAGAGIFGPGPNIAFQVSLIPTSDQKGKTALLIGRATISGEDQWTGERVEGRAAEIRTDLPDDSSVSGSEGIVQ